MTEREDAEATHSAAVNSAADLLTAAQEAERTAVEAEGARAMMLEKASRGHAITPAALFKASEEAKKARDTADLAAAVHDGAKRKAHEAEVPLLNATAAEHQAAYENAVDLLMLAASQVDTAMAAVAAALVVLDEAGEEVRMKHRLALGFNSSHAMRAPGHQNPLVLELPPPHRPKAHVPEMAPIQKFRTVLFRSPQCDRVLADYAARQVTVFGRLADAIGAAFGRKR